MKELKYLNKYIYKHKNNFLLGILFVILSVIFTVFQPSIAQSFVNELKDYNNNNSTNSILFISLKYSLLYTLAALIRGIFVFFNRQTLIINSRKIEYDLKNDIYKRYQSLSMEFYNNNKIGDLLNRITEDVSKVRMYLGPGIMYGLNTIFLTIIVIIMMLLINIKLTIIVLSPIPLLITLIYYISHKIDKYSVINQESQSNLTNIVQETFTGIRQVKAYLLEDILDKRFQSQSTVYQDAGLKLGKLNSMFFPTIIFLIGLSSVLTVYYGIKMMKVGEINTGQIVAFIFYINFLTWPLASIGWLSSIIQTASASQKRINEFLNEKSEDINDKIEKIKFIQDIELKNISMFYEKSNIKSLNNINLKILSGDKIGIIGDVGSGKTTLLEIILGLKTPSCGSLYINNTEFNSLNKIGYREKISYSSQETILFSDTIINNIKFGSKEIVSQENIEKITKLCLIYNDIIKLPNSFETEIGEKGVMLSGGQKQRLALARSIAKSSELLVIDDAMSAIDTETEQLIINNFNSLFESKTVILVSNRINIIKEMKKIIVLNNGEITAIGNHEYLLNNSKYYREINDKQKI